MSDPNYILSQDEFHDSIGMLKEGIDARWRGTERALEREFRELERTAGWIVATVAVWFLFLGYQMAKGMWRP